MIPIRAKQISFLLFLLLHFIYNSIGQNPIGQTISKIVSASPEASTIAMYQNYPLDFVSGLPNIEIPLFDVKTRAGILPFKLSYHVGKIKPSELTGPCGQGWSLSPDIGITRALHGGVDGINSGYPANTQFGSTGQNYMIAAALNNLDEQPDDFYYSLLAKGGEFIYNQKGGFSTIPFDPVRISQPDNNSFIITDDDGTIYKYGKYSTGSTIVLEHSGTYAPLDKTCWKITEIISFDKSDTILFKYGGSVNTYNIPTYNEQWKIYEYPERTDSQPKIYSTAFNTGGITAGYVVERPAYVTTSIFNLSDYDAMVNVPPNDYSYKMGMTSGTASNPQQQATWSNMIHFGSNYEVPNTVTQSQVEEVQLTEIFTRTTHVILSYSGTQLASISLYAYQNNQNKLAKKIVLFQHQAIFWNDQPLIADPNNKRYFLDSVRFLGSDSTSIGQVYGMGYSPGSCFGIYANYHTDFWGFFGAGVVPSLPYLINSNYNWFSKLTNLGATPQSTDPGFLITSPMWVNAGFEVESIGSGSGTASANFPGILSQITYPTGGSAEFAYESNQYVSSATMSKYVYGAGYRIRQIKYKDNNNKDSIIKIYKYGVGENGLGRTKYKNYAENFMYQEWINTLSYGAYGNLLQKVTTINAKPFLNMSFGDGAPILYDEVAEYTTDLGNNLSTGKTVYKYDINTKSNNWIAMTPIQSDPKTDWQVITPASIEKYRYRNSNYELIQKTAYQYANYYKDTIKAAQTFLSFYNTDPSGGSYVYGMVPYGVPVYSHLDYNIYTGVHKMIAQVDTLFDSGNLANYIATKTTFTYDPSTYYKSSESVIDSKGLNRTTNYWYSYQGNNIYDLRAGQNFYLNLLTSSNRINIPVETKVYKNNILLQTVQQNFNQFYVNQISPSAVYSSVLNNSLVQKISFNRYDKYGNILEQQKTNDVKETYLWGYNSQYPVAKIVGSNYDTVSSLINQGVLDNNATSDVMMRTELNKLRIGLPNAFVDTYTFSPFIGATSQTDPGGHSTYYTYDGLNRLSYIKDKDGNVIKKLFYNYGQVSSSAAYFYNDPISHNYLRNNCSAGNAGSMVTYTVPGYKYSAATKAAANLLAINDTAANGQAYANTNGTCAPIMVAIWGDKDPFVGNNAVYTCQFTNVLTGQQYTFTLSTTYQIIGSIPSGTYNIYMSSSPATTSNDFEIDAHGGGSYLHIYSNTATFMNVAVSSTYDVYQIQY